MLDTEQKKIYAAFVSLRGNPDFETVMSWIESEREKVKEMMVRVASDKFQILQGEAGAYGNVLKAYREAPDVVKRLNTQ